MPLELPFAPSIIWGRWKTVYDGTQPHRSAFFQREEPETTAPIVWGQDEGIYVSGPGVLPIKAYLSLDRNAAEVQEIAIEWVSSDESLVVSAVTEPGSIRDLTEKATVMKSWGCWTNSHLGFCI